MLTSINSLSVKKETVSPTIPNILSNSQDIIQNNDKSITTNDSYTILIDKKTNKKRNLNLNYLNNKTKSKNSAKTFKNIYTNKITTKENINEIVKSLNNIKSINNFQNIKKTISPNTSNINSILNPRFITLVNNRQENHSIKIKSPKSVSTTLPKIEKKVLLTEADTLVKERKKRDGLLAPHIPTNIKLKKSAQINLKNYVIRKIKEKREEIQNNEIKITENFRNKQKIYDKRYRNFLDSIEQDQKKQKEEEDELILLKLKIDDQENNLNKEETNNKKLIEQLKKTINSLVSCAKYGSFTCKIFGRQFIYEDLKEFDGKDYVKMMFRFIDVYDKYINDINYQKQNNEFLEMLYFQGVDFLSMQFADMEENIRKQLENNNLINEEIDYLNNKNNNEINLLINRKKESENDKIIFNDNKTKQARLLKNIGGFNIDDAKRYLEYIIELWEILRAGGNMRKNKKIEVEVNEDSMFYCKETLETLEEKELIINKYINEIDNVFKNGKNKDIKIIEDIITRRKKYNIKQKQKEIRKIQEEDEIKKKIKTFDEHKIILKGRKVIQDFPMIKNNKKKKKYAVKKNNDDYEFLYYSSDEN